MNDSTRILVVDDNAPMLYAVARMLRGAGYDVSEATTGEECYEMARREKPELILLDVQLPDINGIEICGRIKSDPDLSRIFVVLFSSVDISSDHQTHGLESGADGYIARPIQNRELLARVQAMLRIRKTEHELRESEALWHGVFNAANDIMLLLDESLAILAANRKAVEMYGFSSEELGAMNLRDLYPPHLHEQAEKEFSPETFSSGKIFETEHITRSGDAIPVEISGRGFTLFQRTRYIYTIRDITERKRAERENTQLMGLVEYQSRRLNDIIANVPGVVWESWIDPRLGTLRTDFVSDYVGPMLGYSTEEWLARGDFWLSIVHPEEREQAERELMAIFENGTVGTSQFRWLARDGRVVWAEAHSAVILHPESGKPVGMRGVTMDITTRKEAEREIRELNETLEQRVLERTAQLQAANSELEAFSYSVSHDLRAPFRHITGFADLLEKRAYSVLDDNGRHYLKTITESARYAGTLVDNLLSFSQMGRSEMIHAPVDMTWLANQIIRSMEQELEGRAIHWEIHDLPEVKGDPHMLRIVLDNLISNAVKYTRGQEDAVIELGCTPERGQNVFFIRDNGVGFDMRYVGKLFGVFQRLHRSEEFEGTGIGLANVQRIIQRHGGRVWAEGVVGEGATFYFSFPTSRQ